MDQAEPWQDGSLGSPLTECETSGVLSVLNPDRERLGNTVH